CNWVSVSGVKDLSTYNTVATTKLLINTKDPLNATSGDTTNLVVIEAEDYDANRSPGTLTPNNRWALSNIWPGFVGVGYIEATPDIYGGSGDTAGTLGGASSLDYSVNFPVAGKYYVWARCSTFVNGSANSYHLNVDNVSQAATARQIGNDNVNWGRDAGNLNKFGWVN